MQEPTHGRYHFEVENTIKRISAYSPEVRISDFYGSHLSPGDHIRICGVDLKVVKKVVIASKGIVIVEIYKNLTGNPGKLSSINKELHLIDYTVTEKER